MYHLNFKRLGLTATLCMLLMHVPSAMAVPILLDDQQNRSVSHASPPETLDLIGDAIWTFSSGTGSFAVNNTAGEAVVASIAGNILTLTYQQGFADPGGVAITVTATDALDLVQDTDDFTITVTNDAPIEDAGIGDITGLSENPSNQPLNVSTIGSFRDPDMVAHPGGSETVTLTAVSDNPALLTWDGLPVFLGGNLGFTIQAGQSGTANVSVTATDSLGVASAAPVTFQVVVDPVNGAPVLDPIVDQNVDEFVLVNLTATATDPLDTPPDNLTFNLIAAPPGATIDGNTGEFNWTPGEADEGAHVVTVEVTDDGLPAPESDTTSFTINVTETNTPPVLNPILDQTVDELMLMSVTPTFSDSDLPADTLTFFLDTAPAGATINATTGQVDWTPAENQGSGAVHPFTVRLNDGTTDVTQSFNVTVNEVNTAPVLNPILDQTVDELVLMSVTPTFSDSDLPADTLTFFLDTAPAGATINATTGQVDWTPAENQGSGAVHPFTVRLNDGTTDVTQSFNVTVNEVNTAPVLNPILDQTVDELVLMSVTPTFSDSDLPADTLTFFLDTAPAGATINATTGQVDWTPAENQGSGAVHPFTVRLNDGTTDVTQSFNVTVNEVNTAPVLNPILDQTVDELVLMSVTPTFSDSDLPADTLTFFLDTAPAGATINATTGQVDWTPAENQGSGAVHPFTVRLNDGTTDVTQSFNVTVNETNSAPVLAAILPQVVDELTTMNVTATATDSDVPVQTLSYSLVSGPPGAAIDGVTGVISWTPTEADGPSAVPFSFTVQVDDNGVPGASDTTSFDVTVNEVNVAPVFAPIADQSIDEHMLLTVNPVVTDPDLPVNTQFFSIVTAPAGSTIDSATGEFNWTPGESDGGNTEPVTIQVFDGLAGNTVSFNINIAETNETPVLAPILDQSVDEETLLTVNTSATDSDLPVQTLTFSLDAAPPGMTIDPATGVINWTPAEADGPGVFAVTVRVTDNGTGLLFATQSFNVTVIEINDPPFLVGDVADLTIDEDAATTPVSVRSEFDDVDLGDTPPDTLTVILLPGYDTSLATVVVNGNNVDVTPLTHQYGTTTVTVGVQDGSGVQATDTFLLTVNSVNDPVQIDNGIPDVGAAEDVGTVSVDLGALNAFLDEDLLNGGDAHTVTFSSSNTTLLTAANSPINDLNGVMNFTVVPNENGVATITVTATDVPGGTVAIETFDITIAEVTDPPFVDNPLGDIVRDEDAGPLNVNVSTTFDDPDIPDGDVLTYTVSHDNPTLVTSATVTPTNLDLVFGADQNGTVNVTVTVTDVSGNSVSDVFTVDVTPVNDDPTVANPIADVNTLEDDPTTYTFDLNNVFADVDILTNGDVLTFTVANTNSGLFDVETLAGGLLSLHLAFDQNGSATITVTATDNAGASVSDSFDFNVTSVNDFPVAADDNMGPYDEDPGLIVIPVLANDYLAEQPTSINSAGVAGASESTPTIVLDPFDDPISQPNGTVTVNGANIEYLPKPNFFGTDYFTYTIMDADGDISPPATVTISINSINDPPEGVQQRTFAIYENQTLTVDPTEGVFTGSYDVDGALLDPMGNPVGSVIAAVLTVPPPMGSLIFDNATGGFQFTPPINFVGEISFFYRLFDGIDVSAGAEYEVRVVINPTLAAPLPPPPGTVAVTYNIANVPLEQTSSVPPNVLVVMDDSGSMDWNTIVSGVDENGGFVLDNSLPTTGKSDLTSFVYLWDLKSNAYPANSDWGRILPTEEALSADADMTGNQYGVWRARNHLHNTLYYNPEIQYLPWTGQDLNNNEFVDAVPTAVRLDPRDPSNVINILDPHEYTASSVPEWDANGGTNNVSVSGTEALHIPRYYATTATPPLDWNDSYTLVEITSTSLPFPSAPAGQPFPGGNGREDCAGDGNPDWCTYNEELQNFANWFQYYRNREYVTKGSIGKVVAAVQDIRIGYETISATTSEPVRLMNELYTEGNKKLLMDNIYEVDSFGGTPLRQALGRAGQIFACQTGSDCPALPAPDGQCQQNFALLFSDGYWNGGAGVPGNDDGDTSGSFDGGRYADTVSATLADVAMYYYETDIQPGLDNEVPVSRKDLLGAPSGTFTSSNNTMHQHMKTYAIAFGVSGTKDPSTVPVDPGTPFAWPDPFAGPQEKIDDMLHAATNGRGEFLSASNPVELQAAFEQAFLEFTQAASSTSAAAFNSTSLRDGTLLYRGFFDLRDNTGELTATVVNTDGTLAASPTWRASEQLNAANMTPTNRRLVTSDSITGDGIPFRHGSLTADQQLMLSLSEVNYLRGERGDENQYGGVLRDRPVDFGLLGDIVNSSPVFVGTPRAINRDQAPYPTTDLYSDFAAAKFNRKPIVYVGANDGIMHGFNAATGIEEFGYIPNKIIDTSEPYHNDLEDFTSPFYQHKYYVDLTPSLNDVYMRPSRSVTGKEWVTLMVGGLGAGGKGYFALNVTEPDTRFTSEANAAGAVLWEFTDEDDTYPVDGSGNPIGGGALLDPDGRPVKDLGMSLTQPTITMSNVTDSDSEKEWVAVFGNGLNSTAGIAKLFVLFVNRGLDGWQSGDFVKIDTGIGVAVSPALRAGYPNGLGTPTAVDVDLNGTVDWVYAGDRLGNLYRFDLTDPNPANWTSTRLFTADYVDGSGTRTLQPILAKPVVSKHPTEDGFLVTFGTGSHVAREDARETDIQSIYTIWDRGETNPATAQSDTKALRLVEQVMSNVVDDSVTPAQTRRILTSNAVNYVSEGASPGVYGWYIDLDMERATTTLSGQPNTDTSGLAPPGPQFPGEKAIRRLLFRDGTIIATTILPSVGSTSCFGSRPGAIILFDVLTGGNPSRALVDFNNDGYVDSNDLVDVGGVGYSAGVLFDQDALDGSLVDPSVLGGEGDTDFLFISGGNETTSFRILDVNDNRTGRLSWQELD